MSKWVYMFTEGDATMQNLLGRKGANLAEMTRLGLRVPNGFTITTEACIRYYKDKGVISDEIMVQIMQAIANLEKITGKKLGDKENPLLVSVRSGASISMPGMLETILNLGLNDEIVNALTSQIDNSRWAWDCYRMFIQKYSNIVMRVEKEYFEKIVDEMKKNRGILLDDELTGNDLKELVRQFKREYKRIVGTDFPTDPKEQLICAIKAVFESWDNSFANIYRHDNGIPYCVGTAVNVQMMVFGNKGTTSGTGVVFTRDPATGEKKFVGEFLANAQGEDIVAGVRTPQEIHELVEVMPEVYDELVDICRKLEEHYKNMQDIEFTIEEKKLYVLQTRDGKRTNRATCKIACDLVDEGMISEEKAVSMIENIDLNRFCVSQFDTDVLKTITPIGKALGASPGAAYGKIVFTSETAKQWNNNGEKVILVRPETLVEDIEGMKVAQGVLTTRGGITSHAAVVARAMGKCCISGCDDIILDEKNKKFILGKSEYYEGDVISLDGTTGKIYAGSIPITEITNGNEYKRMELWVNRYKTMNNEMNDNTIKELGFKS